jgi:hypothetical protein
MLKFKQQLLDVFINSSPYQETTMKKTIFVVIVALATIGLMTAATTVIPMLEDRNGLMQTARAVIDSSCGTWYNPNCSQGWYAPEAPQTPSP